MVRTRPSSTIWSAPCEPETCSGRTWTSLSGTGRAAPRHHVLSAWSPSSGSAARRGYSTRGLGQETPGSGRHVANHRSTTWQPRNPSVTSTWQPRNNHVITTWQPRDPHVTNTWSPREQVERYGDTVHSSGSVKSYEIALSPSLPTMSMQPLTQQEQSLSPKPVLKVMWQPCHRPKGARTRNLSVTVDAWDSHWEDKYWS